MVNVIYHKRLHILSFFVDLLKIDINYPYIPGQAVLVKSLILTILTSLDKLYDTFCFMMHGNVML